MRLLFKRGQMKRLLIGVLLALPSFAGDPWETPRSQWTQQDATRILNASPWLRLFLNFRPTRAGRPLGDFPSLLGRKCGGSGFAPFSCPQFGQCNGVRVLFLFAHGGQV